MLAPAPLSLAGLLPELEHARRVAAASTAPATHAAYAREWEALTSWCSSKSCDALPATLHGARDRALLGGVLFFSASARNHWGKKGKTRHYPAFGVSIDLAPGSYSASAVLVDVGGTARTTQVDLSTFRIFGDDELHTPIDFPASSFF